MRKFKKRKRFSVAPIAELPKPNVETELGVTKSKKSKESVDRNRPPTEPPEPNPPKLHTSPLTQNA